MAEGGGEEKDDNPFSFKKFVDNDVTDEASRPIEADDAENCLDPDLPDVSAPNRRERRDHESRKSSKDDRDSSHSNPFSFKKFLQTSSRNVSSNGPSSLSTLDLAHDLPDFVQDHYSGTDSSHSRHRNLPIGEVPLPDFALDSTAPHLNPPSVNTEDSHSSFQYRDRDNIIPPDLSDVGPEISSCRSRTVASHGRAPSPVPPIDLDDLPNDDSDCDSDDRPRICQTNSAGGLPDFLRDNVVSNVGARPKVSPTVLENGVHFAEDLEGDESCSNSVIRRLTEENTSLRRQLEEARMQAEVETRRVSLALREKNEFVSKDAEETAALENVIHKVEANLETATQRAVQAEKTVAKQKQDIQLLQTECDRLRSENQRLNGKKGGSIHVQDKTRYAAEQLTAAAHTAELQLKQLLSGVDQLKMVAEILSSADKVSDIHSGSPPPEGAEGYASL